MWLGAVVDDGSPGERGGVLVAEPLHLLVGVHTHPLRRQLFVPSRVPLCCKAWPQSCQGAASAWTLASTDVTASVMQRSCFDAGLPLVGVPAAAGHAEPPSPELGPKRHTGWGFGPILGGVPLLNKPLPAAEVRMTCSCVQSLTHPKLFRNVSLATPHQPMHCHLSCSCP